MYSLLTFACRNAWTVLAILLLLTLTAATQLDKVQVQISSSDLLVQDDPERDFYREITRQFGDEQVILLYLKEQTLVAPSQLVALQEVIQQLETLPFIDRTESLFSVPYLKTIDGYLDKQPYFLSEALPETLAEAEALLSAAHKNAFVQRTLLSDDSNVLAVAIVLADNQPDYSDPQIVAAIEQAVDSLRSHYRDVLTVGYPHVRTAVADKIQAEQGTLFPLAIAVLLICLFLLLRQLVDILIPVLTATVSIIWLLGLMGLMDIPLNVVTSVIPVLLIIVGSTEDIHLLSEFRRSQLKGMHKIDSIIEMATKMSGIIVLTFLTTFIGFLSVGLSKIEVLWQFGILSATGLLFNFVITVSLIPAVLKIAGDWKLDGKTAFFQTPDFAARLARQYFSFLRQNRVIILIVIVVLTAVSFHGLGKITINHNPIDSLNQDSPVKMGFERVNQDLSGLESMSVIIDSGIQDTFLKSRYLFEIYQLQTFINEQAGVRSTTSFADYLSLINGAFEEVSEPILPRADDIINELMIFLNYEHVKAYISEDYSKARILIRHRLSSTEELRQLVNAIERFLAKEMDPGLKSRITGDSVLTLSATDAMINGQLQSIALLLISIVVIISMLFLEWRVGLIAAIPNIFPVIVLFGVMGYANIPLNIGTTMAAAIAIGIAVDDTMHFMLRYNGELRLKRNQLSAMHATLHSEALPVIATSLALIGGFSVFMLSDFEPVRQFGFLSAIVMFAALIADFVITPLVISTMRLITLWDMLSINLRKEVIGKSDLFKDMRPWQIRQFILSSRIQNYRRDEKIFTFGDNSESIYLVIRGQVVIAHQTGTKDKIIDEVIDAGDVFGEIAVLNNEPRTSEAVAIKHSSLLIIDKDEFTSISKLHPATSARFFLNMASHISRRFHRVVNHLHTKNPPEEKSHDER